MITLAEILRSNFITYTGYIQLHYEDSNGKHIIICKLSDFEYNKSLMKFKSYHVSNINLDTLALTLTLNKERYL